MEYVYFKPTSYKYNMGQLLWYIDINTFEIRRDRISNLYAFHKEYRSLRQMILSILNKNNNPDYNFIRTTINKMKKSDKFIEDEPTEFIGYNFIKGGCNTPQEFVEESRDKLELLRVKIIKIGDLIRKQFDREYFNIYYLPELSIVERYFR